MKSFAPLPKLSQSGRSREYDARTFEEIAQIVHSWLFHNDMSHRDMDRALLDLDPSVSKGWQSMGVLHYLGLKKQFKGIFLGYSITEAIGALDKDTQDWGQIIRLLRSQDEEANETYLKDLEATGKAADGRFLQHLEQRLQELGHTSTVNTNGQGRREQGILRALLFRGNTEAACALCHNQLPTNLLVAAHIKPRSHCREEERKDPNIVMPVCKIGCDDFFERGYLVIDRTGAVKVNEARNISTDLRRILAEREGKRCSHFNAETSTYFEQKRSFVAAQDG
jgi:hypothetical protein